MDRLCASCVALQLEQSDFTAPPFVPEGKYHSRPRVGTVGELRRGRDTCPLCALIWDALERGNRGMLDMAQHDHRWNLQWAQNTYDYQPSGELEDVEDLFGSALYAALDDDTVGQTYGIQLIDHDDTNEFLRGRLPRETVDIERLNSWIGRCIQMHGHDCGSRLLSRRDLPDDLRHALTVIDVHNQCLCLLPVGERYSALSYVWGDTNSPVTLAENKSDFMQAQGLDIKLPQTVRDAIDVSRAVGLRFLWVDSLCITQDDKDGKQALIDNMDAIYSNAYITLVAATGTGAHSGLSGWSDTCGRGLQCVELDKDLRLGILPYYQRELSECEHAKRAWTYQETCLSPRCLVFLNGYVYFNCNTAVYAEYIHAEVTGIEPEASANTLGKTETMGSRLQHYSQYITSYTSRRMKLESDGLNAFRGIANALAPAMNVNSFFQGIPVSCFDSLILWSGRGLLSRRRGFPSWSWAGWRGDIDAAISTSNAYDQSWLLRGTWINWYHILEDGACRILWDPRRTESIDTQRAPNAFDGLTSSPPPEPEAGTDSDSEDCSEDNGDAAKQEDEDFCPTYGGALNASFGRIISSYTAPFHHPGPKDFNSKRLVLDSSDVTIDHSNAICFSAPCIKLSASVLSSSPMVREDCVVLELRDGPDCICGFVFVHDSTSWVTNDKHPVELILTSVTTYGDLNRYHAEGYTATICQNREVPDGLQEFLETVPEEVDHFDFVNAILMKDTGVRIDVVSDSDRCSLRIRERAGIGFVYRKALQELNVVWDDVLMV